MVVEVFSRCLFEEWAWSFLASFSAASGAAGDYLWPGDGRYSCRHLRASGPASLLSVDGGEDEAGTGIPADTTSYCICPKIVHHHKSHIPGTTDSVMAAHCDMARSHQRRWWAGHMGDNYEEEAVVRHSLYVAGDELLEWTGCEGPVASAQCWTHH